MMRVPHCLLLMLMINATGSTSEFYKDAIKNTSRWWQATIKVSFFGDFTTPALQTDIFFNMKSNELTLAKNLSKG